MAHVQHNATLNRLLIDIGRSLLQYAGQCSSWVSRSEAALAAEFSKLVSRQEEHVGQLSELLMSRRWTIDYGGFPASYTDFHFLSLKYLLKQAILNQKFILRELEEARHTCVDDPEATELIETILTSEREINDQLKSLTATNVAV